MSEQSNKERDRIFNAPPSIPKRRQEILKSNGWGFRDSRFSVTTDKQIVFTGARYAVENDTVLPNFIGWMQRTLGVELEVGRASAPLDTTLDTRLEEQGAINNEVMDERLLEALSKGGWDHSRDAGDRVFRAHGHTMHEMVTLREGGRFGRVPDVVVWPRSHDQVVSLVALAVEHNAVIIPFGGGTSVTGALLCVETERRPIISLDTSQMNRILWLDETNMTVRMEAGITGRDMEERLAALGYCVGHEPDSIEFSSLGGWVATRASGMKKNIYGNIEDLLVHVTMVTANGVIEKQYQVPRSSTGPDIHQIILGSEGTLGVVTEVTLKIKKLPKFKKYASIIFPDFESGFKCLREVARQNIYPASIRLMDNEQFHFGLALKVNTGSIFSRFFDGIKKLYLLKYRGFDPYKLCVATILMEGDSKKVIVEQEKRLMEIAKKCRGISGGEENGKRGYLLTFVIAYIRDLALDNYVLAESFETSVPWDRTLDLCQAVKNRVQVETKKYGITKPVLITCRITQLYDAGVCVYFYLAINYSELINPSSSSTSLAKINPVDLYEHVETAARDEILNMGGSLSHHHGIGKIRKQWLRSVISPTGLNALEGIKRTLDPNNIFANGSLFDDKLTAKL